MIQTIQEIYNILSTARTMFENPGKVIYALISSMFEWLYLAIGNAACELANWVLSLLEKAEMEIIYMLNNGNSQVGGSIQNMLQQFFTVFQTLGWVLWAVGFALAVLEAGLNYEKGNLMIRQFALNILKSFLAVNLFVDLPLSLFAYTTRITHKVCNILMPNTVGTNTDISSGISRIGDAFSEKLEEIRKIGFMDLSGETSFFFNTEKANIAELIGLLAFVVIITACIISVAKQCVERGALLFCQIGVGSLYMFGAPRGYDDGLWAWCKQVVALCLTGFLQRTMLFIGLAISTKAFQASFSFDQMEDRAFIIFLVAIGFCSAARHVPEIAREFGLHAGADTTSMSGVVGSARTAAVTAGRAINAAMKV